MRRGEALPGSANPGTHAVVTARRPDRARKGFGWTGIRCGLLAAALLVSGPAALADETGLRRLTPEERRQMNAQLAEARFAPCDVLTLAGSRWSCRATTRAGHTYAL
ncbi:hypothetical protein [Phreatobacter sp.]|uniref:hypothetical protein n=1 Tax=Phreatobacter sp. TaxID=1966341 RepID=UPI003F6E5FA2